MRDSQSCSKKTENIKMKDFDLYLEKIQARFIAGITNKKKYEEELRKYWDKEFSCG